MVHFSMFFIQFGAYFYPKWRQRSPTHFIHYSLPRTLTYLHTQKRVDSLLSSSSSSPSLSLFSHKLAAALYTLRKWQHGWLASYLVVLSTTYSVAAAAAAANTNTTAQLELFLFLAACSLSLSVSL